MRRRKKPGRFLSYRDRRRSWRLTALACAIAAIVLVSILGYHIPKWMEKRDLRQYKPSLPVNLTTSATEPASDLADPALEPTAQETESAEAAAQRESERIEQIQRERFQDLLAVNSDAVGWITVPGTSVDFPLLQTTDNAFYLRHDLHKNYERTGIPFVDYETDLKSGPHIIIYGHNMSDTSTERFSQLRFYRDPDFCRDHPTIQLDTLYESTVYKVVAVYVITALESDPDVFHFNRYITFADDGEWQDYLDEVQKRAFYTVDGYAQPGEKLLSLCTCMHVMENDRIIIMARPLREGERGEAEKITVNQDPLLPGRWPSGA